MKCEDCKYFIKPEVLEILTDKERKGLSREEQAKKRDDVYEVGECRRFPPSVKPEDYGYEFINVYRDFWCGEFQEKEKQDN